jgi:hypothetical protein
MFENKAFSNNKRLVSLLEPVILIAALISDSADCSSNFILLFVGR